MIKLKLVSADEAAALVDEAKTRMPAIPSNIDRELGRDMGFERSSRLPVYDGVEIEHPARGRMIVYKPQVEPFDHGYVTST